MSDNFIETDGAPTECRFRLASVFVLNAPYHIDRVFDYTVPIGMTVKKGDFVAVPFGIGNRPETAVVFDTKYADISNDLVYNGTKELINAVARKLDTLPPVKRYESEEIPVSVFERKSGDGFTVTVHDGVYIVEADWLYRILCKTDLDDYESLQYFQRVLQQKGVIDALIEKGISEGDTVSIYDLEFDYVP